MTRQVFQDDLAVSRMTRQTWDHHRHQYESRKTPAFTPTQIPSHITVHATPWSHDHKQKPLGSTGPPQTARHSRYANPHWKSQRREFGYAHNSYEKNNYLGPHWHHNDVRHRPFVPRQKETVNVAGGTSKGYNPSRFRYVSDNYVRSLKENNINCSQTSQQRNVQIAVIKPIARVENLKDNEIVSGSNIASDNHKNNKDHFNSCKSEEGSSIKEDDTILKILDYQLVSSDICSTNVANEKQKEYNINSNCIEIKPNASALYESDTKISKKIMQVSSNCNINQYPGDQKDNEKSDTKKLVGCIEGETNLPPDISNFFAKHTLGENITKIEWLTNQENLDNTLDKVKGIYDPLISNNSFDISPNQYKDKKIERIELLNVSVESNSDKFTKKLAEKNSPNSSILEAPEPPALQSPVKCWSPRKPTQECLLHNKPSQDTNVDSHVVVLCETAPHNKPPQEKKLINMKADVPEYLSVKPFSPYKKPELQVSQRVHEKSLHESPFQTLGKCSSIKKIQSINSDVLTPEMLRERLFRKFINSSELINPVENDLQNQSFLIEREKTIESLMSSTLKIAGIYPTDFNEPPKQDKPALSIKKENSNLPNLCTNNNTGNMNSPKQVKSNSKIERCSDSFNENLPLSLFNENTLKILSDANLFRNLDIHLLKDILSKIDTPPTEPISNTIKNTESALNFNNSSIQNIVVTKDPKENCDNTATNSESLKIESNIYENLMSTDKNNVSLPLNEEEIDTSVMLNLENEEEIDTSVMLNLENEEEIDTSVMLNLESVEESMLNSVSVVCLQSEIWGNELDKNDAQYIKSERICEQSHANESSSSSKSEPETKIICEEPLDSHVVVLRETAPCSRTTGSIEETCRDDVNISNAKIPPDCNSSLKICSSNNEILSNDIDEELSIIEYNLNKIFGMAEENNIIVPEEKPENVNSDQHNLKPIKNTGLLNEDVQYCTADDLPTHTELKCESFIYENGIDIKKISDKSIHDKSHIEYSPSIQVIDNHDSMKVIDNHDSMKVIDNHDSISISSDEVGDGDDSFPGEENYDSRQPKDDLKFLREEKKEGAEEDLKKNKNVRKPSNEKAIENKDNDFDFTSNVKKGQKDKFELIDEKTIKFERLGKSKIRFNKSNERNKTFEIEDDLPDLNKTNLEKSFNYKTEDENEFNFNGKENVATKSENGSFKSEMASVSGKSDLHKTDILKWKVSHKRAYIFSKENLQSFQVTGSSKNNFKKQSDVNNFFKDTLTTESIKCENGNCLSSQKKGLLHQDNCNIRKMTIDSQVKLKRLCDSDFSEHIPKKINMKTSWKCKPKDRKRKMIRVSTCLSPKSLSKELETSSYIIENEVSNTCPLGHSLEKCYSTVNINTDIISVYCKSCKKTILMGERT